jgi:hypothetical protein
MKIPHGAVVLVLSCAGSGAVAEGPSFPPDAVLEVTAIDGTGAPRHWQLAPTAPGHRTLEHWLADHGSGWRPFLATPWGTGLLISAGDLRLQFFGDTVLACRAGAACVQRTLPESDYRDLLQP